MTPDDPTDPPPTGAEDSVPRATPEKPDPVIGARRRRGGSKKGERRGGSKRGSKQKKTLERELRARLAAEFDAKLKSVEAMDPVGAAVAVQQKKLMVDILRELAQLAVGLAGQHQPWPASVVAVRGPNPNQNIDEFKYWVDKASDYAHKAAPFESPRFSAVMVGATTVTTISVDGGMPDDFVPPKDIPEQIPAGTIITADYVVEPVPAAAPAKDAA